MTDTTRYTITFNAKGPDAAIRLRQMLKVALRRFALRCTACEELTTDADTPTERKSWHNSNSF